MNVLIILAHPNMNSFNRAIAETASETLQLNGYNVIFHDLYKEGFNPVLIGKEIQEEALLEPIIEKHCMELSIAEGIIVVHPNWWGQPPAILKGWIDRVFRPGIAYKFLENDSGEGIPIGLLKAKAAIVFNTSNTPERRELDIFGDPLETLWKNCIFGLCGVNNFHRKMYGVIVTSTLEQREYWLRDVKKIVTEYFPLLET
ncbi:MAG: NAD(P)H-dependent oxidoreductase [Desulfobacterales bacterium]|nr:NAD(P)H-dependent oxidoreductase [Desulfobacterales bacterium]MBF0397794.1 NAD(P)H-dependent oxidoreductase [Desulfobacterales bacterium]